jgi:hypothetical protein
MKSQEDSATCGSSLQRYSNRATGLCMALRCGAPPDLGLSSLLGLRFRYFRNAPLQSFWHGECEQCAEAASSSTFGLLRGSCVTAAGQQPSGFMPTAGCSPPTKRHLENCPGAVYRALYSSAANDVLAGCLACSPIQAGGQSQPKYPP